MNLYVRILRKEKAGKNGSACVFVALLAVALIIVSHHTAEAGKTAALNIRAASSEDRIAYLSQFGWSVKEDPVEVCEVIIPAEFDDVYENTMSFKRNKALIYPCMRRNG